MAQLSDIGVSSTEAAGDLATYLWTHSSSIISTHQQSEWMTVEHEKHNLKLEKCSLNSSLSQ